MTQPRVAILSKRSAGSGNLSTADRIGQYLRGSGHCVVAVDACGAVCAPVTAPVVPPYSIGADGGGTVTPPGGAGSPIDRLGWTPACIIGLHAHHAGQWLAKGAVPYVLIFGGTDVYAPEYRVEPCLSIIVSAVRNAAAVVAFTEHMRDTAAAVFGVAAEKVHVVPQAICPVPPDTTFSLQNLDVWPQGVSLPENVFILPAGLRPVKDVLFLAAVFDQWHHEDPSVALLILGDEFDAVYASRVRAAISGSSAVRWSPALPQPALFQAFSECSGVVNSSVSEGQCGALLEAMFYGCPILARRNFGNCAMLEHDVNALLFDTPDEFLTQARQLCARPELRGRLVAAARHTVNTVHSPEAEAPRYCAIVKNVMCTPK
eukprot:m.255353 g.255353  ORF g.255353 m.255353 type:complete len:374 (-) comp26551_c0_seq1:2307-3428(-)